MPETDPATLATQRRQRQQQLQQQQAQRPPVRPGAELPEKEQQMRHNPVSEALKAHPGDHDQ